MGGWVETNIYFGCRNGMDGWKIISRNNWITDTIEIDMDSFSKDIIRQWIRWIYSCYFYFCLPKERRKKPKRHDLTLWLWIQYLGWAGLYIYIYLLGLHFLALLPDGAEEHGGQVPLPKGGDDARDQLARVLRLLRQLITTTRKRENISYVRREKRTH